MPSKPRSEIFIPDEVGIYHCWNKLVRGEYLFGNDRLSDNDYSYRKVWVRDQYRKLAGSMAIDVLDYAVLDNHLHVVLRNRPDIVSSWPDEEVARRWWYVCPTRKNKDGSTPEPRPKEIAKLLTEVDELRGRLSDISWMMRLACQRIAIRANREDGVEGRFFAHRFECERLETPSDVLSCSLYLDLNWIRAGMAETPEQSIFTSAYDRIRARWRSVQKEMGSSDLVPFDKDADNWLAPIFLDERAEAYVSPTNEVPEGAPANVTPLCNPVGSARISDKGFLPMTLDQYLTMLDALGRVIRSDKRGSIPAELPPILERLNLDPKSWFDSLMDLLQLSPNPPPATAAGDSG